MNKIRKSSKESNRAKIIKQEYVKSVNKITKKSKHQPRLITAFFQQGTSVFLPELVYGT